MTDEDFRKLCNVYGFAPSRALRELIDCVRAQEIEACTPPDSKHETIAEWWADKQRKPLMDDEIEALADAVPIDEMTLSPSTWHLKLARAIERAHGIT